MSYKLLFLPRKEAEFNNDWPGTSSNILTFNYKGYGVTNRVPESIDKFYKDIDYIYVLNPTSKDINTRLVRATKFCSCQVINCKDVVIFIHTIDFDTVRDINNYSFCNYWPYCSQRGIDNGDVSEYMKYYRLVRQLCNEIQQNLNNM
ncbi:MAG: hypothetical protein C4B58_04810 [Deltaproteobacteria bacterium]|nr:MAG: hypothetical protein C4B58_04810 [Deltaproteobacteria bacterium]